MTNKSELAQYVVDHMDYQELHESAIAGLVAFYEANPEQFQEDLVNNGFEPEKSVIPEGSFNVQIGRDATVYWSAILQADSLEELQGKLHKTGMECPEDTEWNFDGYNSFDNVEVCIIELPDGTMWRWTHGSEWEEVT